MNYIVVDFEWNQSPYGKEGENKRIPFEIIEIGAVRLNDALEVTGRFSRTIKPKVYRKLHFVTRELTGITEQELTRGESFPTSALDFFLWCGEDSEEFMFCTWGNTDLIELQRNLKFYQLEDLLPGPIKYYNVQKLYRCIYDETLTYAALETAAQYLNIHIKGDFHRALCDAEYTAAIFKTMDMSAVAKLYTVDYYQNPKTKKEEIKLVYDQYAKYISREFDTKEAAVADREVRSTRCYKCGKPANKVVRWFAGRGRAYFCVAFCKEHGYVRGKLRLKRSDENKVYVVKTLRLIDEAQANELRDMKEEVRIKRQERRHKSHDAQTKGDEA